MAGLQVRRAEPRPAADDRPAQRADRRDRRRLPARSGVPASLRAAVRGFAGRLHPGPAGLPRLGAGAVLPTPLLLLPLLLRPLATLAQRTRRRDLRRHDGPDPPQSP